MGQSPSSPLLAKSSSSSASPPRRRSLSSSFPMAPPRTTRTTVQVAGTGAGGGGATAFTAPPPERDLTQDLPDEILTLVFASLSPAERNACSLTCARWKEVAAALPSQRLARLKLRGLRQLSDDGLASLARATPAIRKLSVSSCSFGPKAFVAVLRSCPLLEDLSVKRLRGLPDTAGAATTITEEILFPPASLLRSVCLKDLYSALCFVPLVASSPNLRSLKILRCSGAWDLPLEVIVARAHGLVELHLEKLQVGDRGLAAVSACANLEVLFLVKTPECTDAGIIGVADKCHNCANYILTGGAQIGLGIMASWLWQKDAQTCKSSSLLGSTPRCRASECLVNTAVPWSVSPFVVVRLLAMLRSFAWLSAVLHSRNFASRVAQSQILGWGH
ncbi:hypothetical protein GUJ93_ZPchr0004g39045 [Zizania palustris]|uniref:F-box domain-containing protein n=1 Tax=Zizania palustris TaxID=103762 RepID=A0A8J5S180_ZIZPA|nr:hypothetical protein GUJ93_ZPchr0004g39045 [Zizania palustris]